VWSQRQHCHWHWLNCSYGSRQEESDRYGALFARKRSKRQRCHTSRHLHYRVRHLARILRNRSTHLLKTWRQKHPIRSWVFRFGWTVQVSVCWLSHFFGEFRKWYWRWKCAWFFDKTCQDIQRSGDWSQRKLEAMDHEAAGIQGSSSGWERWSTWIISASEQKIWKVQNLYEQFDHESFDPPKIALPSKRLQIGRPSLVLKWAKTCTHHRFTIAGTHQIW